MSNTEPADVLTQIIKVLTPLKPEDRRRTVAAAMLFLGETAMPALAANGPTEDKATTAATAGTEDGNYPAAAGRWITQYGISEEEIDRVFHFNIKAGTFDILDVPGKSKREQTLNTYVLAGLGRWLMSDERTFDDGTARGFCEKLGCYDNANHAAYLKNHRGGEFSGDKGKGYMLTNMGLKRGAAIIKELGGAAE
jgi:hypothetical protein